MSLSWYCIHTATKCCLRKLSVHSICCNDIPLSRQMVCKKVYRLKIFPCPASFCMHEMYGTNLFPYWMDLSHFSHTCFKEKSNNGCTKAEADKVVQNIMTIWICLMNVIVFMASFWNASAFTSCPMKNWSPSNIISRIGLMFSGTMITTVPIQQMGKW